VCAPPPTNQPTMFTKESVIDARGHMMGRLASLVAKELLNGQKLSVVRCEDMQISGSLYRNRLKYMEFKRKGMNSNPRKGQFHFRAPSKMFWRVVRGMMPHKTARGQAALDKLSVYEGVPHPFDRTKKMVVPQALKVLRLKSHRKFCALGDLANSVGWKHQGLTSRLEEQRKVKADSFYKRQKALKQVKKTALKSVPSGTMKVLAELGH